MTLVWAVREVVQAAHAQTDDALRAELMRVASELAAATGQLGSIEGSVASAGVPFEQMVDAAREAFNRAHQGLQLSPDERTFFNAYVHQLKHIASLLAVGGHSVDSLLRGAVGGGRVFGADGLVDLRGAREEGERRGEEHRAKERGAHGGRETLSRRPRE